MSQSVQSPKISDIMADYNPFSLPNIIFPSGDVTQPWSWLYQFAPITINQMKAGDPRKEAQIVQEVASYGRQLGRIIEVMNVLLAKMPEEGLAPAQKEAIAEFREMSARIQAVKEGYGQPTSRNVDKMAEALEYWKENDPDFYKKAKERLREVLE